MLKILISQIGLLLMLSVCLFAWWKGGRAERAGALAVAVTWIVALASQVLLGKANSVVVLMGLDAILAVCLLVLAIRYSSAWLGVAMVLQGVVLALHAQEMEGAIGRHDYYVYLNLASSGMLLAIVTGAVSSWRKRVRARRSESAVAAAPPPAVATPA